VWRAEEIARRSLSFVKQGYEFEMIFSSALAAIVGFAG
jgi:hypothetical protein